MGVLPNVWPGGQYIYTEDLLALHRKRPPSPVLVPPSLASVHTPLHVDRWAVRLQSHPDCHFVSYLRNGLIEGFWIGFDYDKGVLRPAKANMVSARDHPEVITSYLKEEIEKG